MNTATSNLKIGPRNLGDVISQQLQLFLEQKNYEAAKTLLLPVAPVDIAEAINQLPKSLQLLAFRLLNKPVAIEVYEYFNSPLQQLLLTEFQEEEAAEIINNIAPDERVKLFDELPPIIVKQLIKKLSLKERKVTSLLLGYSPETAGRIMTPEYMELSENLTVEEAQAKIRELAQDSEVFYYGYITDQFGRLLGIISLKDLILATPEQPLNEIMKQDIIYAYTDTDQEKAANLMQRYNLLALPILDRGETLLGVVTIDDIIDIIETETTEDVYKMAAVEAEGNDYFEISLLNVIKKRIPWLLILLVTNSVTVLIMSRYEAVLDAVVALAFFTPLLIDTGGNIGAQSSTVVIRGFSTHELKNKKPPLVVWRELITGGMLGVVLGILAIVLVFILLGTAKIGITVGISLLVISIIAAATGAALPFVFKALGFDPALISGPFITTIVDIVGILIYLNTAKLLLPI
ncbi:magnesium transporter [Crocosphaera sp. XPORK-15E]|uniref:magnesium transporter n=1 Tax=Crocosphaera sp. XPORK-15E TaxID=3110247 RepID=UPI002B217DCE|nr:magnesium transporter [Crocosphaera sp. XPORK-15E]MEA5535151.1 magnesium transporter [Crocosphaera sp. XPORK-15E]